MHQITSLTVRRTLTALALGVTALWAQAAEGEIKKIDRTQAKVTLKHGEIKSLDMPPMTMAFRVRPPQLLDGLNEGDRVSFTADKVDGLYVVTQIKKLP